MRTGFENVLHRGGRTPRLREPLYEIIGAFLVPAVRILQGRCELNRPERVAYTLVSRNWGFLSSRQRHEKTSKVRSTVVCQLDFLREAVVKDRTVHTRTRVGPGTSNQKRQGLLHLESVWNRRLTNPSSTFMPAMKTQYKRTRGTNVSEEADDLHNNRGKDR